MRGHAKITPSHLARTALVYVRQSTLAQVRNNTESTARQYGLADQAARLGWAGSAIEVIDADLGLSGRSAQGRAGFKEVRWWAGSAWARLVPSSAWRSPAWPAPRPTCPSCWSWPA